MAVTPCKSQHAQRTIVDNSDDSWRRQQLYCTHASQVCVHSQRCPSCLLQSSLDPTCRQCSTEVVTWGSAATDYTERFHISLWVTMQGWNVQSQPACCRHTFGGEGRKTLRLVSQKSKIGVNLIWGGIAWDEAERHFLCIVKVINNI